MINNDTDCLLVIDVQNDFCPGGALGVPDGDKVIPVINHLGEPVHPPGAYSGLAPGWASMLCFQPLGSRTVFDRRAQLR